nr:hypothetical protein [Tanacetum cinerariifolium]
MELYMQNREHGRMILESVEHGLLIWPTIKEKEVTRTKKYAELFATEKLQADCDMKEINIILQGDDLIACLHKVMAFLTTVASSRVTVQQVQGRQRQSYYGTGYKSNSTSSGEVLQMDMQGLLNATTVKTEDLDTYDSDCDDVSNAKAVLMANISNYGFDVISEVPHFETYLNDMENQIEQSFWFCISNPTIESSNKPPVKVEVPSELPKHESCDNQNALEIPKFFENNDLKAQVQDKDTTICMVKLDLEPLGILEQAKAKQPLDNALDFACKKGQKVRFAKPLTSSRNIKQVESSIASVPNTPVLSPTGLKCSTSNCGLKPTCNKKNDKISRTPSRNMKYKVEA